MPQDARVAHLGRPLNCKDISSAYCQRVKGVVVERLDHYDRNEEAWQEILVPDRTCTPAELAASRIDFPGWLDTLRRRDRRIAMTLAGGETTSRTARKFHISSARVSQIRRQLQHAWYQYQSESLTRVAKTLAGRGTTTAVARRFCVSAGRISQIRRELCRSWQAFADEMMPMA